MDAELMRHLREIALALPGASEGITVHHPSFKVAGRAFVMCLENHHDVGWTAIWCKSTHDDQRFLIESDGERFFAPPYVGPKGWVGFRFIAERPTDWAEVSELIEDAFRLSAGKRLLKQLDAERE